MIPFLKSIKKKIGISTFLTRPLLWFLILLLELYRKCISPGLGSRCRFYPSCSAYALESLRKYGLVKGLGKSMFRVCRCHPFCKGGVDYP